MTDPVSNATTTLTSSENIAIAALVVVSAVFLAMIVALWRDGLKSRDALHRMQIKTTQVMGELNAAINAVLKSRG